MREKHRLVAFSYMPQLGIEPTTQVCALTRDQTRHHLIYGTMLQSTEPHGPGQFFKYINYVIYMQLKHREVKLYILACIHLKKPVTTR